MEPYEHGAINRTVQMLRDMGHKVESQDDPYAGLAYHDDAEALKMLERRLIEADRRIAELEAVDKKVQALTAAVDFYRTCPRCDGDGDEPNNDHDELGPAPCKRCEGMGQGWDQGKRAEQAIRTLEDAQQAPEQYAQPSRQTVEIAVQKWLAGYRPGDELWSDYDQTAVYYLTSPSATRDIAESFESAPSATQCPNCGGSQPCIREDCQGAHEPAGNALKPCPFCGSTNINPHYMTNGAIAPIHGDGAMPGCECCGAMAADAGLWNSRSLSGVKDEREAILAALDELIADEPLDDAGQAAEAGIRRHLNASGGDES